MGEACEREFERMNRNQSTFKKAQAFCELQLNDARDRLRKSADKAIILMKRLLRTEQVSVQPPST